LEQKSKIEKNRIGIKKQNWSNNQKLEQKSKIGTKYKIRTKITTFATFHLTLR